MAMLNNQMVFVWDWDSLADIYRVEQQEKFAATICAPSY